MTCNLQINHAITSMAFIIEDDFTMGKTQNINVVQQFTNSTFLSEK